MQLAGKTVLLTGGSSGIGLALGKALVAGGASVFSFDPRAPEERVVGMQSITVDITKAGDIERGLARIPGEIDVLINNAGVMRRGTVFESSEADFDLLFAVHVKGAWLLLKHALPCLTRRAVVVQMSSLHALYPVADPGLYTLTKQAARHLAELAQAALPHLQFKFLFPGPVNTPLARFGVKDKVLREKEARMVTPEEVARKIVALIESKKTMLLCDGSGRRYQLV